MPPRPKLPVTPRRFMMGLRYWVTASDAPPAPVWKEKPGFNSPLCSITWAA